MSYWSKIVLVLCAIWALAAGVIYFAHAAKPTAASIANYVQKNDLGSLGAADRKKAIDRMVDMLNRTTLEERQKLREEGVTNGVFPLADAGGAVGIPRQNTANGLQADDGVL